MTAQAADSRTVATDALETLGTIITEREKRDAIHLGVEPVIAAELLFAGQHVALSPEGATMSGKHVGIVDPFLPNPVKNGERFWLVVYPRQITSLRHVWEHPDFPASVDESPVNLESIEWMQNKADELEVTYEELVDRATAYVVSGAYWNGGDAFEGVHVGDEFWDHYVAITGRKIEQEDRGSFFTCSC